MIDAKALNKLLCAFTILLVDCIGAFAPYLFTSFSSESASKTESYHTILSLVNTFGGGAMLSLCLLHLIPEALQCGGYMEPRCIESISGHDHHALPIFWYCVIASFTLVLVLEKIPSVFLKSQNLIIADHHHQGYKSKHENNAMMSSSLVSQDTPLVVQVGSVSSGEYSSRRTSITTLLETSSKNGLISSYLLMIALTIHAVLEGVVVGTALTSVEAWKTTLILSAHKWVEVSS